MTFKTPAALAAALLTVGFAGTATAQVVKVPGGSANITNGIDFDTPLVPSGPLMPGVFAGTGITSVAQVGTWNAAGDVMSTGLHNGQNLVSQGGVATVIGNLEALDNPTAGAGWDIALDAMYDEFQCAFTDQSGFAYDIELFAGAVSLGVGSFTYSEGAPNQVAFRAAGPFDSLTIRFPNNTGGLGIDDLGVGNGPGPMVPANDECATAIAVGNSSLTPYSTVLATLSLEPWPCATGGGPDVWYTYTAAASFGLRIETCGSGYDTALEILEGSCGTLTSIACNDDDCGTQSGVFFVPTPGTTYYIRAGGWSGNVGNGQLSVVESLSPPNDECTGAFAIGAGATAFDTTAATPSGNWPCALGSNSNDLWYSYTATSALPVTFETCGSGYDTALELLSGDCANLVSVACNDDACGLQSSITASFTPGETVLVRVGGFNTSSGAGTLTVTETVIDSCVETIFANNNQGGVGGVVYFDMTLTQDVSFSGLKTNYTTAAGTPVGVQMYVTAGTWVGNNSNAAAWTLVGEDDGAGTAAGLNARTSLRFSAPVSLTAGGYGVALVAVDGAHGYTNGNGMNQNFVSPDGVVTLDLGGGANTPFSTQLFMPRVWNGSFCYDEPIGTSYCGPAAVNASGLPATIAASGSPFVAENRLVLTASDMPAGAYGMFLASPTQGFWPNPGGAAGNLCLGGAIGRGVGGRILQADAGGSFSVGTPLTSMPTPIQIRIAVQSGETWNYQAWFRDAGMSGATSNFSDAVSVPFL